MFPDYVLSRPTNALRVVVGKKFRVLLLAPAIPKGVRVKPNIIPNIHKLGFIGHDLQKFLELDMKRYMTIVRETKDGPIHVV